jgi:hypothetical protein
MIREASRTISSRPSHTSPIRKIKRKGDIAKVIYLGGIRYLRISYRVSIYFFMDRNIS